MRYLLAALAAMLLILTPSALADPPTGDDATPDGRPSEAITIYHHAPDGAGVVELTGTLTGGVFSDGYADGHNGDIGKGGGCVGGDRCAQSLTRAFFGAYPFAVSGSPVWLETADGSVRMLCLRSTVGGKPDVVHDCQTAGQEGAGAYCDGPLGADLGECIGAAAGARNGGWVGADARWPGWGPAEGPTFDTTPTQGYGLPDEADNPTPDPELPPRPVRPAPVAR